MFLFIPTFKHSPQCFLEKACTVLLFTTGEYLKSTSQNLSSKGGKRNIFCLEKAKDLIDPVDHGSFQ